MTERLLQEQQVARLLGRAAELQEHATRRAEDGEDDVEGHAAGSYGLAEIQAAATEAGIDAQFVALAALELAATAPGQVALTPVVRRRAERWLGARESQLAHVQRFHGPIAPLLATIGVTVQSQRYGMRLAEATPDLERGGTMLLDVPQWGTPTGTVNMLGYYLRGVFGCEHLRLSITPRGPQDHEVVAAIDIDQGWPTLIAWAHGTAVCLAAIMGAIGAGLASSLAAPLVAAVALVAVLGVAGMLLGYRFMRWCYGYYVRKAQEQLRELLCDVDAARRSQAVFGVLPPGPPAAGSPGSNDAALIVNTIL